MDLKKIIEGIFLLVPFVAVLVPQLYNSIQPTLGGLPFFVWYQIVWLVLGGILLFGCYVIYNTGRVKGDSA